MRRALIPAFLVLFVSFVLGATVFREQVAWAAANLNVFVTNDSSHPVPVQEQRVDANQNIKVHEQGTATVQQAGTPVRIFLQSVGGSPATYSVPADKRLVIQYVNGFLLPENGFSAQGELRVTGTPTQDFSFVGQFVPNSIGRYDFSEQVTIYADPGSTVSWIMRGSTLSLSNLNMSGYLIPA